MHYFVHKMRWKNMDSIVPYDGTRFNESYIYTSDLTQYDYSKAMELNNVECTKPYYYFYQFVLLSSGTPQSHNSLLVWKIYTRSVWYLILSTITILSILSMILNYSKNINFIKQSFDSIWCYALPLIQKGDSKKPFHLIYLFWLFSAIPIVEIFKNDLLANLVTTSNNYDNSLMDLVKKGRSVGTLSGNYHLFFHKESSHEILFRDSIMKLKNKFILLDLELIKNLMEDPSDVKGLVKRLTLVDYEYRINWIYETFKGQMNVKIGDEKYWPRIASIACFRFNKINKSDQESFMDVANEK